MAKGRNALCPCGSGKKYKKCCLRKTPQQLPDKNLPFNPPKPNATDLDPGNYRWFDGGTGRSGTFVVRRRRPTATTGDRAALGTAVAAALMYGGAA